MLILKDPAGDGEVFELDQFPVFPPDLPHTGFSQVFRDLFCTVQWGRLRPRFWRGLRRGVRWDGISRFLRVGFDDNGPRIPERAGAEIDPTDNRFSILDSFAPEAREEVTFFVDSPSHQQTEQQ